METFLAPATSELLKLGLPGVVIIGLAVAYWRKDVQCSAANERAERHLMSVLPAMTASTAATNENTRKLHELTELLHRR